jgi:hypothetical protein
MWRARAVALLLALASAGCASSSDSAPYPHEYILTVFAELKMELEQDPYRLPPGRDLEGHNIFRVSLQRLDELESLTVATYDDVLAFARGQCLERLGDWPAAAAQFDRATSAGTSLSESARQRAAAARRMDALTDRDRFNRASLESYLNELDVMERRLLQWVEEHPPAPYDRLPLLEAERGRVERARLLFDLRRVLGDGAERAIRLAQALTEDFADSYRISEHRLLLGSFYEQLARDETREFPPEGRTFDADGRWARCVEQARLAYRTVALTDGDPIKPEGEARLRALDAWALRIHDLAR